jgi:hypothetical protein
LRAAGHGYEQCDDDGDHDRERGEISTAKARSSNEIFIGQLARLGHARLATIEEG